MPKPGGGERLLAHLDPRDAVDYARAVARVARAVERALEPAVLANRARGDGLSLLPWKPARRRLRSLVDRWSVEDQPVLAADVLGCYGSIAPGTVERALRRLGCDPGEVVEVLDRFARAGVPGLPIGPDGSAILANAVLANADRAAIAAGSRFVRWVDDYLLVGPESLRGLEAIAEELGRDGLSLRADKTRWLERRDRGRAPEAPAPQRFSQGRLP